MQRMTPASTRPHDLTRGQVTTEGDDLYYEIRGQGPPLLLIPGGGGDAGFYARVCDLLAADYRVITYDRRGNSRSTRHASRNFTMAQQSRDAVAVLRAAGETAAFVFGNSGGGVIALDLAATQPQAIRAAVVHEAPLVTVLPDSQKWLRFAAWLYWLSFAFGSQVSMLRFALAVGLPGSALRMVPPDAAARMAKNQAFFVRHEMLGFMGYQPDIARIRTNGVPVIMAAGQWTLDRRKFYGRPTPILARQLGGETVTFPGNHISYLDRPQEWAATLRAVLQKAQEGRQLTDPPAP